MIDRRRRAGLVEEALNDRRIGRQLGQQHLERNRTSELRVLRPIHHAHAALTELGHDPVVPDHLTDHASSIVARQS
jgi:hypothetical protein